MYADEQDETNVPDEFSYQHQEILKRFDELKDLLRAQNIIPQLNPARSKSVHSCPLSNPTSNAASDTETTTSVLSGQILACPPQLSHPMAATRCESLLKWSIFHGVISGRDAQISSFVLDPCDPHDHSSGDTACQTSPLPKPMPLVFNLRLSTSYGGGFLRLGVHEQELVPLC